MPTADDDHDSSPSTGDVYKYTYEFTDSTNSCIQLSVYAFNVNAGTGDMTYSLTNEGLEEVTCEEFGTCTYIFSRGYNRACDELSSLRVVQREIAVDF